MAVAVGTPLYVLFFYSTRHENLYTKTKTHSCVNMGFALTEMYFDKKGFIEIG